MFPFIHESGTIYFASEGHLGLGGLDVFMAYKDTLGEYIVENVGAPINSSMDDFGYIIDKDEMKGYFSSNRIGGQGDDDIYRFKKANQKVNGVVRDIASGVELEGAVMNLVDNEGKPIDNYTTTIDGTFEFKIASKKDYKLVVEKPGYVKSEFEIKAAKSFTSEPVEIDVFLITDELSFTLNKPIRLNDIYYDLNRYH